MPQVLCRKFSNYFDPKTKVHFTPLLDRSAGCFVGLAQVTPKQAELYAAREGFQILTSEEVVLITTGAALNQPEPASSGDPLTDAGKAAKAAPPAVDKKPEPVDPEEPAEDDGPPAPPDSK